MDVNEAIVRRRSIRRFQDRPVPYDILEKCVDAGRVAPSARNFQLCEYIIVDDAQLLPRVFDCIKLGGWQDTPKDSPAMKNTPKAYIIILINSTLEAKFGSPRHFTTHDVGLSAENIILTALEQGLGVCPVLLFQPDKLKPLLKIPDSHDIALVLVLGYPNESPVVEVSTGPVETWIDDQGVRHVPKRKLEDITHRNQFP